MPNERTPSSRARKGSHSRVADVPAWTVNHQGAVVHGIGDQSILQRMCLGLICSVQCPGSVVIKTFDAIRELRDAGIVVVGGFHSPMEKECMGFLLRGEQPVIFCPARGLASLRIGRTGTQAMMEGRLLIVSPFTESTRRTTSAHAVKRNHLVTALASALLVPHAAPEGKAWATARLALDRRQPVFTFVDEANRSLMDAGARPFEELDVISLSGKI